MNPSYLEDFGSVIPAVQVLNALGLAVSQPGGGIEAAEQQAASRPRSSVSAAETTPG